MESSGRHQPGRAGSSPSDRDEVISGDSADDLAQQPDEVLETVLAELAPGVRRDALDVRAARIEADRRLVARAAEEDFNGPITKGLLLTAHEYAFPVMGSLIGTRRIFAECRRLRRPVKRRRGDERWTKDDRTFLNELSVDTGIFDVFHKLALKGGRWDPACGTALTTFGVNACIMCFKSAYEQWWRTHVLEHSSGDLTRALPFSLQIDWRQPDPADRAVNWAEVERLFLKIPEPARTALWLRGAEGMTQAEAADHLGLTEKSLEGRIGRARAKLKRDANGYTVEDQQEAAVDPEPESGPGGQEGDCD